MNARGLPRRSRWEVRALAGACFLAAIAAATPPPLDTGLGPQLFLDDHIIGRMTGLRRELQQPVRHPEPVLDRETFGTTQHHITVLRGTRGAGFRAWYNRGDSVWHAESADGLRWTNPRLVWELPYAFGAAVIDDGDREPDPQRRFKIANWQQLRRGQPGPDSGMWVGFSPDGLNWTGYPGNPVLLNWPEGVNVLVPHRTSDIIEVFHDPLRGHYAAYLKLPAVESDGFAPAPRSGRLFRRLIGISTSTDFIQWERPRRILLPDEADDGLLEFYGMSSVHQRGGLYIGMVRVLRDDLAADPGGPKDGIGYTCSLPAATVRTGRATGRRSCRGIPSRGAGTTRWPGSVARCRSATSCSSTTAALRGATS